MGKAGYYSINYTRDDLDKFIENPVREANMIALMIKLSRKYTIQLGYDKYSDVIKYRRLIYKCKGCSKSHLILYNFQTEDELVSELDRFKVNMCDECIEKERNRILNEKILKLKGRITKSKE